MAKKGCFSYSPEKDLIHEGRAAKVYKARIDGKGEYSFALKVTQPQYRERLKSEILILNDLCDSVYFPNLAGIYLDGSEPAFAMNYMDSTLEEYIGNNKGKFKDKLNIFSQMLEAMEIAHSRGYAHKDLKPANILLDDKLNVRITDFGNSRTLEDSLGLKNSFQTTQDIRHIAGSLGYLTPEHVDYGEIDEKSDIFALGTIFYEMLAGKRPDGSENLAEQSQFSMFDSLIKKCRAYEKKKRFKNVSELRNEFTSISDEILNKPSFWEKYSWFFYWASGASASMGFTSFIANYPAIKEFFNTLTNK